MHNLQQQMMPPPSMFPSHSGVSPGPSKVHVPPPPPLSPHMISTGASQQMSAPPYNNVQYNNSHYGGRGPPGSKRFKLYCLFMFKKNVLIMLKSAGALRTGASEVVVINDIQLSWILQVILIAVVFHNTVGE